MLVAAFVAIVLVPIAFIVYVLIEMPSLEALENPNTSLSTVVYSADKKILGTYYKDEDRINIKFKDIPRNLHDALVATEDVRFYEHAGVDPIFILTAPYKFAMGEWRGGSTLTMQLSRNLYDAVGRERSIWRKLKEMIVSVILESRYTKREIMVGYLNTVPWGGTYYGIHSASKAYFSKNPHELKTEESAMLVGLLKGPSEYSPYRHPDRAKNRRNDVLEQMSKYGFIKEAEAKTLKEKPLGVAAARSGDHNEGPAPYFREHVRAWLKDWCAERGINMYTAGLRIYTTINSRHQQYAEEAVREHMPNLQKEFTRQLRWRDAPWKKDSSILNRALLQSARYNMMKSQGKNVREIMKSFREKQNMQVFAWEANGPGHKDTVFTPIDSLIYYQKFMESGFVSLDPTNGHVLAWVGGMDHRFFQFDHVQKQRRQVGSTFKPFVYTAAFDNGFSPCHEELNMPVEVETPQGMWRPKNFDETQGGYMTLRKALALSKNLVTARLMKAIGPQVVVDYAHKMGIESPMEAVHAIGLGTADLSVLELTSAFATYADQGRWHQPIFIRRIEDKFGNVLEEFKGNSREALSEETTYLMVDMLRAVVNEGTGYPLRSPTEYNVDRDIDMGGKTGTTQNASDGWFVGFTPYVAAGVWVGNSDRSVHFPDAAWGQGGKMALPVFARYLKKIYADKELAIPRDYFKRPSSLKVEIDCRKYREKHPRNGTDPNRVQHPGQLDFDD